MNITKLSFLCTDVSNYDYLSTQISASINQWYVLKKNNNKCNLTYGLNLATNFYI